jgi:hypothetical protein
MKMSWAIVLAASVGFGTPGLAGAAPISPIDGARTNANLLPPMDRYASLLWSGPRGLLRNKAPARSSDGIIAVCYRYNHQ